MSTTNKTRDGWKTLCSKAQRLQSDLADKGHQVSDTEAIFLVLVGRRAAAEVDGASETVVGLLDEGLDLVAQHLPKSPRLAAA